MIRGIQVTNYYIDKFLPVFKKAGDYEKCELAYRFMMSVYDFCKFTFAGKEDTEPVCISSYSDKLLYIKSGDGYEEKETCFTVAYFT